MGKKVGNGTFEKAITKTRGNISWICQQCQKACPGKAITGALWDATRGRDWIFDAMACRKKAREIASKAIGKEITLCGKCIESCPYTQKYISS